VQLFWKLLRLILLRDMKISPASSLVPEFPIVGDLSFGIVQAAYHEALQSGKVRYEKTQIARFIPDSKIVEFKNGKSEEFDLVVYATGYTQQFPFFDQETIAKLQIPFYSQSGREVDSPFRLYRGIVPITGPSNIGFVGIQNANNNYALSEIQSRWLVELFLSNIHLPNESTREKDVEMYLGFEKNMYPNQGIVGCNVLNCYMHMTENLLMDLNIATTRTNNFISEYFLPCYPIRYHIRKEIENQRAYRTPHPLPATPHYLSFAMFVVFLILLVYVWRYLF